MVQDDLARQYGSPDPLQTRIDIHRRYQVREIDLDVESAQRLALTGNESLLDTGCGPGHFLKHLRSQGHAGRLVGLDQSAGMIAQLPESVEGVVGDVQQLPFADGEFDWVVARHMLYHVEDIPRALSELLRVARQGLLITTNSRKNMAYFQTRIDNILRGFGRTPEPRIVDRFCVENAGEWLSCAGVQYTEAMLDNELVFRSPEPMTAYLLSCLPSVGITPEHPQYAEIEYWAGYRSDLDLSMVDREARLATRVGFYLVSKR